MQPPVKGFVTMGLDPGYRNGCKVAVVDATGKVLDTAVVYPTFSQRKKEDVYKRQVYPFREAIASGEMRSVGLGAALAFAGILLTAILTIRRVRGALLLGILAVWGAAILCQLTGLYVPNAELGMASVLPDFSAGLAVPSLAPTFMQMDFTGLFTLNSVSYTHLNRNTLAALSLTASLSLTLAACGSGGGTAQSPAPAASTPPAASGAPSGGVDVYKRQYIG